MIPRLKEAFNTGLNEKIKKELGLENVNQIPTLEKIVLNIGSGKAGTDGRALESIVDELTAISGQKPVIKRAKKSIAGLEIIGTYDSSILWQCVKCGDRFLKLGRVKTLELLEGATSAWTNPNDWGETNKELN